MERFDPVVAAIADPAELLDLVTTDPPARVLLDLDLGDRPGDGADLVAPCVAAGARVLVMTGTRDRW
jgi:ActR/RegA family two-component response regulator